MKSIKLASLSYDSKNLMPYNHQLVRHLFNSAHVSVRTKESNRNK